MSAQANKTHPILIVAAVSVIILSITGVGAIMGWIPTSASKTGEQITPESSITASEKNSAIPEENSKSEMTASTSKNDSAKTDEQKPATAAKAEKHHTKTVKNDSNMETASSSAPKSRPAPACNNCGVISSIDAIEQPGEGTGLGAIAGGVAGALLGSQIGQGNGTTVATIAGAAGGAYAGHQVEKNVRKSKHVEINVRMDDGSYRTFNQPNDSGLMTGDKVKVVDGALVRD